MPKDLSKENVNTGKIVYEWYVQEYEQYDRSKRWYLIASLLGVSLVAYALITANYMFALVVALFGIVLYLHEMQPPLNVYFAITETGIIVGQKYYKYSELSGFWLIYNPPEVKNLYFRMKYILRNRLRVPLQDFDPRPIREYLSQFMVEEIDEEEEPLSDRLARILKVH